MTTILFPSEPLSSRSPDPDFVDEMNAARSCGFDVALIRLESLLGGNVEGAVAHIDHLGLAKRFIYRGWMVSSPQYAALVEALSIRGLNAITSPSDYEMHHEYPGAWSRIPDLMPKSRVFATGELGDIDRIVRLANETFEGPVIIKDFVKSRKHEWFDACFIPDIADSANACRVVRTFLQRQGNELQGGLVIRSMLSLVSVGMHPKSQMPIPVEYRTFFFGGKVVASAPYWHELEYQDSPAPPQEFYLEIAGRMGNGFFTADTVLATDGSWHVIEVGDGQVSQIPERLSVASFYEWLRAALTPSD